MYRNVITAVLALAGSTVAASIACAQTAANYPNGPITYIIPNSPGGASDASGRIFAKKLSEVLGQPVVVENKSGGVVGVVVLAQSKPDGYTLGHISSDTFSITPQLGSPPYDVFKDFTPVAYLMTTYTALVSSKTFAPNSVQEMVAFAKANPGKVSVASTGIGGYTHLLGEILKRAAGIEMLHVPYSNTGAATLDILAGRVDLMFDSTPVEHVSQNQVKGYAAVGLERIRQLPNLPTMVSVLPSFNGGDIGWGFVAPAGLPPDIVKKLSDTVGAISKAPDYVQQVEARGYAVSYTPYDGYAKRIREEYDIYKDTIQRGNIKAGN